MPAQAPLSIAPTPEPAAPQVVCTGGDGCSYLLTLSTIERIAGFDHSAGRYAAAAARCREQGCRAGAPSADTAAQPNVSEPVSLASITALASPPGVRRPSVSAEPIPFSRADHLDILSDGDGNFVERRQLKPQTLPAKGDPLGYLYRYWSDLRGAGALQFSSIDTVHLARAGVIGSMHVVDVSSGDPNDFHFVLFGYAVPLRRPERPRALPVQIYADTTMRDYNTVRMVATPRLHHVRCHIDQVSYHYTRLILPFLDAVGRVDRLLVAIRKEPGDGVKVEAGN